MPANQILGKMIIILMADTNYDSIELPLIGSSEKINQSKRFFSPQYFRVGLIIHFCFICLLRIQPETFSGFCSSCTTSPLHCRRF